ncbi:MAG: hypothetical protein ACJ0Q8_00855 [Candidatus Azotimanducaceae bacterium]
MNELAQLVPTNIDFSILASLFGSQSAPIPYVEMLFVLGSMAAPFLFMCFENKEAWERYGFFNVLGQCFGRVALDIGLVIGICGSAIGVVALTLSPQGPQSDYTRSISIGLLTMLWGGIYVGLGYFIHNPAIAIKARISKWGVCFSLYCAGTGFYLMSFMTNLEYSSTFLLPLLSDVFVPYWIVFALCILSLPSAGKPWVVSLTDANLLATIGGLGMGIVLWFTSGGGYEEGRAAIFTCALVLMWGCLFYVIAYIFSLYLGTQEQGNYQTKTWHLSEAAVFFIFLLYAPVGATEWQRESKDQAVQEANNQAQQQEIDALKAQIAILMKPAEKASDT